MAARSCEADLPVIVGRFHFLDLLSYNRLAFIQGLYYFAAGMWPVLSITSFVAATGPKTDLWLVRTVGLLLTVIGASLLIAAAKHKVSLETFLLATGSALALAGVEFAYVNAGLISPIYLIDTLAEIALISFWSVVLVRRIRNRDVCMPFDDQTAPMLATEESHT